MHQEHKEKSPTIIVIFGATGDLAKRKLVPALLDLYVKEMLPDKFEIVAFSRRSWSDVEYRDFIKDAIDKKDHGHSGEEVDSFISHFSYVEGDFKNKGSYKKLKDSLELIDQKFGQCSNKLFYLAVPPILYEEIFSSLSSSKLSEPCGGELGWTRILVEKPFGNDTRTARKLDSILGDLFKEEQIFRIDHYLAKETLQNILAFRFSNHIFEPLWSNEHIESIHIKLLEDIDIQGRGAFYDPIGALRDVGQNHILQILAIVAMDKPSGFDSGSIRKERAKILKNLISVKRGEVEGRVSRAQYRGYLEEEKVKKNSKTETYFQVKAELKGKKWKGVPFYLESGKAVGVNKTEVSIRFKTYDNDYFGDMAGYPNILTFRIQPDDGIEIKFWAKKPGFMSELEPKLLNFDYEKNDRLGLPDAYERILHDCIKGDQTLFISTEEVDAEWKFITSIRRNWKNLPLLEYNKGHKPEFKT